MKTIKDKYTTLYKFNIFEQFHQIRHFITSRQGGVSKNQYKGLNIGFGTNDNPENVSKNREILSESLGIPLDWFVFPRQTHSANIEVINTNHKGKGALTKDNAISDTDALITSFTNVCIIVQVADCVPILLLDPVKNIVATIHAGWRGTAKDITLQTVLKMIEIYGSNPPDIIAGIGPSIGCCCYEVGSEVIQSFNGRKIKYSNCFMQNGTKQHFDLWQANKNQLLNAGLKEQNIEISEICTHCNNEYFFSSRHEKGDTGRFLAGIMLQ